MKKIIMLVLTFAVIDCQAVQQPVQKIPKEAVINAKQLTRNTFGEIVKNLPKNNKSSFIYNPDKKEQFVFHKKVKALQKYGYKYFCFEAKSCFGHVLPYETYVGMKGYFDTKSPAKIDSSDNEFYPVVLENGKKLYFVSNKNHGKYGSFSPIISLKLYQEIKNFKSEPLIPNSNIQVVSKNIMYNHELYILSNGKHILKNKLELIREVANRFGNNPEIAELLLDFKIKKDEVDFRFFISPIKKLSISGAKLYIGFNDKTEWLRFSVKYYGDDWLFINSYKIAADNYRWQSPKLTFERDNSGTNIWEWSDVLATAKYIEVAKALSEATKSTIRFQGEQYYSDTHLTDVQKEELKKILKLYLLMGSV